VGNQMHLVHDRAFLMYVLCRLDEILHMNVLVRLLFEIFHQCSYKQRVVENEVVFIGVIIATK
jgi:hypothetical protein